VNTKKHSLTPYRESLRHIVVHRRATQTQNDFGEMIYHLRSDEGIVLTIRAEKLLLYCIKRKREISAKKKKLEKFAQKWCIKKICHHKLSHLPSLPLALITYLRH